MKHVIRNEERDVSVTIIEADSCTYQVEEEYDIVITSPPWPEYNNAANGIRKLTDLEWENITQGLARACAGAKAKHGIKGLIEIPANISDKNREQLLKSLSKFNLKIVNGNRSKLLGYISGHRERDSVREWLVVYEPPLSSDNRQFVMERYPILIQKMAEKRTKAGYRDKSYEAWKDRVYRECRGVAFKVPPMLAGKHLVMLFSHILEIGDTILDPFAGTGETAKHAATNGINSISIDNVAAYVAGIQDRLSYILDEEPVKQSTTHSRGTKAKAVQDVIVDVKQTEQLKSREREKELGLISKEEFRDLYGIDLSQGTKKGLKRQLVSHLYTRYEGRRPSYLYRHPKQGELREC